MQIYAWQMDPSSIDHRSMQHHYTKEVSHIEVCTYMHGRWIPSCQSSIDHCNTTTLNLLSRNMEIVLYRPSTVSLFSLFHITYAHRPSLSHCNYVIGPPSNQPYISWTPLHQINVTYRRLLYQLRYLMRKVVVHNYYQCVIICQIDSVRICVNWSAEKIVHITFLNIVCKNMWWGGIDTSVKTVTKYSSKSI